MRKVQRSLPTHGAGKKSLPPGGNFDAGRAFLPRIGERLEHQERAACREPSVSGVQGQAQGTRQTQSVQGHAIDCPVVGRVRAGVVRVHAATPRGHADRPRGSEIIGGGTARPAEYHPHKPARTETPTNTLCGGAAVGVLLVPEPRMGRHVSDSDSVVCRVRCSSRFPGGYERAPGIYCGDGQRMAGESARKHGNSHSAVRLPPPHYYLHSAGLSGNYQARHAFHRPGVSPG